MVTRNDEYETGFIIFNISLRSTYNEELNLS